MPFGISEAPLTFQRLVNHVLQGLTGDGVHAFIDDIIVSSEDVESHLKRLEQVLQRFREVGLTLRYSKCAFLRKSITYLGYKLDGTGVHTTPEI